MYKSCSQSSTSYNYCKNNIPFSKSIKISQLKSQLVQLEEDDKAYNELLQKYRQLQNDYHLMNEARLHLEYEIKQKDENTNKLLNDLKCQNIDLINEINEKNNIYKKLYSDNTNLYRNLEDRKKENEELCKIIKDNEDMINHLNEDKSQCEHEFLILNQNSQNNEKDIKNLCNELNSLKIKSQTQNDELNKKNIEINASQANLSEIKNDNTNLNKQITLKTSTLETIQNQLIISNKSIENLQIELSNLEKEHSLNNTKLDNLKVNYQTQHEKRIQIENENIRLNNVLKEREDSLNKLNCLNETLKSDREKLLADNGKLISNVDYYKNQAFALSQQVEKLSNELQRIIEEDSNLFNLNNEQIQRLQQIIYENKKLLSEEIQALNELENYVKGKQSIQINTMNQNISKTRVSYELTSQ
jgi:chromosome segregation ATPase